MNIWQALGFIALGIVLEWLANRVAWLKYYEGKRERRSDEIKCKVH